MPTCQACNINFPNRQKVNGVLKVTNHRKYCLSCCPFGERRSNKSVNPNTTCERCGKLYQYFRNGCTLKHCNTCISDIRRRTHKQKAVDYLGGKCTVCGYNKCVDALDFHHTSSDNKMFNIANRLGRSWKIIQNELDKCILLCANCHREKHSINKKSL